MKTAAPDFKIFWDEAYIVHHLTDEIIETPVLLNESKQYGTEDRVFMFTSTSKITFPGAGVPEEQGRRAAAYGQASPPPGALL